MAIDFDTAASRHGRDRNQLPSPPRLGPYEDAYDVRRGYQQPLDRASGGSTPSVDVYFLRARKDGEGGGRG